MGYTSLLNIIRSTTGLDEKTEASTVKKLILAGEDVNEQSGPEAFSPLHFAIIHCKPHVVKTMLASGKVNLRLVDKDGFSALHMVAAYRDYTDQTKQTHEMQKEKKIAEYIIQYSKAINLQDKFGNTPLHTAVINGNKYIVALLLEKDYLFPQQKLLGIKNKAGRTVLHEGVASGKQGEKILTLLVRIASQQDFEAKNTWGETPLEMVDRLIKERNLLKNDLPILVELSQLLLKNTDNFLNRSQRVNTDISFSYTFQDLSKKFIDLMNRVKELPPDMNALFIYVLRSYTKLCSLDETSQPFVSDINFFTRRIKNTLEPFRKLNNAYIEELVKIKEILLQSDFYVWKEGILRLPSSFIDYQKNLPDASLCQEYSNDDNYQTAKNFYDAGIYAFNIQDYPYAIKQLSESISYYRRYFPDHIRLADAHYALGLCYQDQFDGRTAEIHLKQSKAIYLNLQAYPQLEKVYQSLVEIQIDPLNINYQKTQLDILMDSQYDDKEKFCAHIALANFYKLIRTSRHINFKDYDEALNRALITHESYHYSLAYELTQGPGDQNARLVLQREIGISLGNQKLGTYNIQQCVALFAYHRQQGKSVLLHIDRFSGPLTIFKQLFRQFPTDAHLDVYLSGGRDQTGSGKLVSDNNINQILKGLYYYRNRVNILATDLGDKPSPPAVVFDSDAKKLVHRIAQYSDVSLSTRAAQMNLNLNKENNDYLYPLHLVNYAATVDERKRNFNSVEIAQLTALYHKYYSQASPLPSYKSWYHNQILFPLLSIFDAKNIKIYPFDHPISFDLKKGTIQNNWNQIGSRPLFLPHETSPEPTLDLLNFVDQQQKVDDFFNQLKHESSSETSSDNSYKKPRLTGLFRFFEEATENSQFDYWLEQSDVADIARIAFDSYRTATGKGKFEIVSNEGRHLETQLQKFKNAMLNDESEDGRLTLIISLDNNHWVTAVVQYQQNSWSAFYVNSASGFTLPIPETIAGPLRSLGTVIYNLSHARQRDVSNCGLWALEAAELINTLLDRNPNWRGLSWEEELDQKGFSTHFFKQQRKRYTALLRNDFQRLTRKIDELDELLPAQGCGKRRRRHIGPCFPGSNASSERLDLLQQAQSWSDSLSASHHLQADWIPILATAREVANRGEEIYFYNFHTQEEKVIFLPQKTTLPFREKLHRAYKNLYGVLKFISRHPEQSLRIIFNFKKGLSQVPVSHREDAETIDGLNAAFTIQAVLAFFQQKNREKFQTERGSLSLALEIHTYINIMQMAHGTTIDMVRIVGLVKTLLHQESLVQRPLSAFTLGLKKIVMEGIGMPLGIISVGLDITELAKASTEAEKTLFGTQLAFDSGGLILSASSMGAAFFGASEAAAALSGEGVIVAGLGIGIAGLVQAFNQVVAEAEAVGNYFYQVNEAYKNGGYKIIAENDQTYLIPCFGAVISEINFKNATITYGSQFIYRTHPRSRGVYGNGKTNYISWVGDMPTVVHNKTQALNIRERLGYRQRAELGRWKASLIWILPYTPISYIDYAWTHLPFATARNDNGFSVLRRLEEKEDFDYDFYIFPSEYIINKIFEKRIITPIVIHLDNQVRAFLIPKFSKQDRELYAYIRYIFQASSLSGGECYLYLDKVGSIRLEERHANYRWILSAEGLSDDTLLFTDTGITIGNIPIEIAQHQAQYHFIDKTGKAVFLLDFINSSVMLISIDYKFIEQHHPSLQAYVQSHALFNVTQASNSIVILTRFELQDENGRDYQGKAYYSVSENRLFYSNHLPKRLNKGSHLVHITPNSAYFFNSKLNFFWRTEDSQHRLAENYVFLSEFIHNNSESTLQEKNIVSVSDEEGVITVVQAFSNLSNTTQRYATYHILDNKPLLIGLQDDILLRSLQVYSILIDNNQKEYNEALQNLCLSSIFHAKAGIDPYPTLSGRASYAEFNQVIHITPLTQQSNLIPLWVRRNKDNNCQLIHPKRFTKSANYLGSLFISNQREVFFFFIPRNKEVFGELYRQIEGEPHAIQLDLTLISAFFTSNTLLVITSEGILKKIDALGRAYTLSFTHEWTNAHANWWKIVPLCLTKSPPAERYIPLFGITDQSGKALAVWYDTKNQRFVLAHPPLKANGQQFHMTYLGRIGNKHFFHSENKTVYYQRTEQNLMRTLFRGTQLKKPIATLNAVAIAEKVYLHNQKVWVQIKSGFLFSFSPQNFDRWFLEKIYLSWFHGNNCINNDSLKGSMASVVRNESEFIKYCLSFIFSVQNRGFSIPDTISMQDAHFNFSNTSLIPIENGNTTLLWWKPEYNQFFSIPQQKDTNDWVFLAKTANQDHYFFSAKEKIISVIPTDTVMSSKKNGPFFITDLALRFNKSILWQLRVSYRDSLFIPLFEEIEVIEFDIILSEQRPFVLHVSEEGMNHYQTIAYQTSFHGEKDSSVIRGGVTTICFDVAKNSEARQFFAFSSKKDIVISHTQYACQLILTNAMTLQASQNTSIQFRVSGGISKFKVDLSDIKNRLEASGTKNIFIWPENIVKQPIKPAYHRVLGLAYEQDQSRKKPSTPKVVRSRRALADVSLASINNEAIGGKTDTFYDKQEKIQAIQITSRLNLFKSIDPQPEKYGGYEKQVNPPLANHHYSYFQQYATKSAIPPITASFALQETLCFLRLFLPKYERRSHLNKKIEKLKVDFPVKSQTHCRKMKPINFQ